MQSGSGKIIIFAGILVSVLSLFMVFLLKNSVLNTRGTGTVTITGINPDNLSCKNIGEASTSNFDERTGKIDPNIAPSECCPGLIAIQVKDTSRTPSQSQKGICGISIGGNNSVCAPCGNGICDSSVEDYCNCAVDCKK